LILLIHVLLFYPHFMKKFIIFMVAVVCLASSCGGNKCCEDKQLLQIGDDIAIVNTTYGTIQGYIYKDVYTFLGIPYGAPTGGANRFMPPQEPEIWDGVRPALFWGNYAPQRTGNRYSNTAGTFTDHWNYYDVSEDCLNLNVWTPAPDKAKRPVLVWFHGGGFVSGNSIEHDGYDGNNISREGDIVFVSVNHRLGPLGFSDLSAFGEKYAFSGNVGVMDLVAALKWVNANIANFGGDPSNVTIMGQSGGGSKVCTVLAMGSAKGMVHKAVALSGNTSRAMNQEYSRKIGEYVLAEAGLKPSEVDKLQEMPWEEYFALANKALAKYRQDYPETVNSVNRFGFAPVEDGVIIPKGDYYPEDGYAANIPVIFSSAFSEASVSKTNAELEEVDKAGAVEFLKSMKGDKAQAIIDACEAAFPDLKPIEWIDLVANTYRPALVVSAAAKYKQGAPVWNCWFAYKANLFDGRMRAFHCSDICYWFKNTDLMYTHTGGGPEPRTVSDKMSSALLSFMRTGNPNCDELPQWPQWDPEKRNVMLLDTECKVLEDPDRAIIELLN